jgi:NAD(P)-dependent dehydrogenase (short-subunit alcohol dehydrogenase family)
MNATSHTRLGGQFDTLLRNDQSVRTIREAWNHGYSLNVTSTQVFTHQIMGLLLNSSNPRLLFVTSGLASLSTCAGGVKSKLAPNPPVKGWPKAATPSMIAYRSSKTALNMMMLEWVRLLQPDGVKVFSISPGFLATNFGRNGSEAMKQLGAGEASVGGRFIKDVVEGMRDGDAGKVINKDGVQPW